MATPSLRSKPVRAMLPLVTESAAEDTPPISLHVCVHDFLVDQIEGDMREEAQRELEEAREDLAYERWLYRAVQAGWV